MSAFTSSLTFLADSAPPLQAHAPQLIDVDGTLVIQLGLFLFLALVLTKLLWKPYLRVRAERVTRVEGYRKDAARMEADATARLAEAEAGLAEARRVGGGERNAARAEAQAREHVLIDQAQDEARRTLAAARGRLDAIVGAERTRLQAGARDIAAQAARRILGREVTPS